MSAVAPPGGTDGRPDTTNKPAGPNSSSNLFTAFGSIFGNMALAPTGAGKASAAPAAPRGNEGAGSVIDVLPPEPSGPPKVYFKMLGRRSSTLQDESAEEVDCGGGISEAQLFLDVKVQKLMALALRLRKLHLNSERLESEKGQETAERLKKRLKELLVGLGWLEPGEVVMPADHDEDGMDEEDEEEDEDKEEDGEEEEEGGAVEEEVVPELEDLFDSNKPEEEEPAVAPGSAARLAVTISPMTSPRAMQLEGQQGGEDGAVGGRGLSPTMRGSFLGATTMASASRGGVMSRRQEGEDGGARAVLEAAGRLLEGTSRLEEEEGEEEGGDGLAVTTATALSNHGLTGQATRRSVEEDEERDLAEELERASRLVRSLMGERSRLSRVNAYLSKKAQHLQRRIEEMNPVTEATGLVPAFEFKAHDKPVASLLLAPDETHIFTCAAGESVVKVWSRDFELDQWTLAGELGAGKHQAAVTRLAMRTGEEEIGLLSGDEAGCIWHWAVHEEEGGEGGGPSYHWQPSYSISAGSKAGEGVRALATKGLSHVYSATEGQSWVGIWRGSDGSSMGRVDAGAAVSCLLVVGESVVCGTRQGFLAIVDCKTHSLLRQVASGVPGPVRCLAYRQQRLWITGHLSSERLAVLDLKTGSAPQQLEGHSGAVVAVAAGLQGRYVFSASSDNTIIPWASRSLRASGGLVSMSSAPLTSIAAGEQTLVLGSGDGTVQVWGPADVTVPQQQSR